LFAALLLIGTATAARAEDEHRNRYVATILVSNEAEDAPVVDPLLKNAWGIAAGPNTPWWVADNGTGMSTIYTGAGEKRPLEVLVNGAAGPAPATGLVFNGGTSFELAENQPAIFIFAAEDGTISGWNPNVQPTSTVVKHSEEDAIYKGLAIHGDVLYSTDFGGCSVDALGPNFEEFDTPGGFADRSIPSGYCPFGVQVIGDSVFVTYAKKEGIDDVAGIGHGFVREFDTDGNLVAKVGSRGLLNSPWGVALAPEDFGKFGGCLLVGNFGDGKVNAFCQKHGEKWHHAGRLRMGRHLLSIDGLWGIAFGNGGPSGDPNVLYFAAGPDDEENGYYGKIEFAPRQK
jgi:uncharacterized protein (TIGR03118 family)